MRRRPAAVLLAVLLTLLTGAAPASAALDRTAASGRLPTTLALPDGFQPEGIAIGPGPTAYFGSRVDGDLYRVDLGTGRGRVFSAGPGTPSLGLKLDRRGRLFVAGGTGGDARVVDARTGRVLASYAFATGTTFVNDVVLTPRMAWFTDSRNPVLYGVPLARDGALPGQSEVRRVALRGDFAQVPDVNNANGITRTPDGRGLLVVQSATGLLFRVDSGTGHADVVDLGGYRLANGDGMLLEGCTLYVVQNRLNRIAVLHLDRRGTRGHLARTITDPRFDVPTTAARFRDRLYLPNARFTTPPTPATPYTAVAVRL
jgi:sugar lactone lactonase YvrE